MAFGQQSGPPASRSQMNELEALLEQAGHVDFRDARGPMGFTQRQANGKFTRDEADAFITALQEAEAEQTDPSATVDRPLDLSAEERALRRIPVDQLAAELQRRGWIVVAP
jgi:hypothetical protein